MEIDCVPLTEVGRARTGGLGMVMSSVMPHSGDGEPHDASNRRVEVVRPFNFPKKSPISPCHLISLEHTYAACIFVALFSGTKQEEGQML